MLLYAVSRVDLLPKPRSHCVVCCSEVPETRTTFLQFSFISLITFKGPGADKAQAMQQIHRRVCPHLARSCLEALLVDSPHRDERGRCLGSHAVRSPILYTTAVALVAQCKASGPFGVVVLGWPKGSLEKLQSINQK